MINCCKSIRIIDKKINLFILVNTGLYNHIIIYSASGIDEYKHGLEIEIKNS